MEWHCGRLRLDVSSRTLLMGIVNATPDSFSGDGTLSEALSRASSSGLEASIEHALAQARAGANILDIGGESTRPGASPVSAQEEAARVVPLVRALRQHRELDGVAISVDTTKAAVAREAIAAGADIINDISGATFDSEMLQVLADSGCGLVLMHLRGTPQSMGWSQKPEGSDAPDVIEEVLAFWRERIHAAGEAGIEESRIALDAGFGFGKSAEENLELIRRGRELQIGFPVVSATSRKSTIGRVLGRALDDSRGELPVEERLWGTATTVALAIAAGAQIVRVHDVREMAQVARMSDAILRGGALRQ